MKHKRWQAIVMIAFAWVLWDHTLSSDIESWEVIDGYISISECKKAQKINIKNLIRNRSGFYKTPTRPMAIHSKEGKVKNYPCLPTTNIDPRPRSKK